MCVCRSILPVLGVIQIFVGLLNIGLGPGRTSMHPGDLTSMGAAYWLGAVYIITGIVTITVNCCPYFVSVMFAVTLNIISSVYAIIGIVLYALDLENSSFIDLCQNSQPSEEYFNQCQFLAYIAQRLVIDMDITLIVLAVLQLGVSTAITVLGIRALCGRWKEKGVKDAEIDQPILKEVLMTSPGAEKGFTLMFGSLK